MPVLPAGARLGGPLTPFGMWEQSMPYPRSLPFVNGRPTAPGAPWGLLVLC